MAYTGMEKIRLTKSDTVKIEQLIGNSPMRNREGHKASTGWLLPFVL